MMFVKETLADHPPKLAIVASGSFLVVAVETNIVDILLPDNFVEMISRQLVAYMLQPHLQDDPGTLSGFDKKFCILDLPTRHRPHTFTSHSFALNEGSTGSKSTNFGKSTMSHHDIDYYRALDDGKFASRPK